MSRILARVKGITNPAHESGEPLLPCVPAILQFNVPPGANAQPGDVVDVIVRVEVQEVIPGDVPG